MRALFRSVLVVAVLAGGVLAATPAASAQDGAPPAPPTDCTIEDAIAGVLPSVFQVVTERSLGTAFYVGDGEFLTAAHVVAGATEIRVQNAHHTGDVTIVGADPDADIAILSGSVEDFEPSGAATPAPNAAAGAPTPANPTPAPATPTPAPATPTLAPLTIGDSTTLGIGERLIIVGYPLFKRVGDASVTLGVLSGRVDDPDADYVTSLQTDAAANPGNSGGPIIDICGEVVGIVTSKQVGTAVEGIAYAVAQSTFAEAMVRARDLGPEDVAVTTGAWTVRQDADGTRSLRSVADFHVYTHWPRGGGNPPRLLAFCSDAGRPVVFMWWDVEELIGGAVSRRVAVSLQFDRGGSLSGWQREYWVDLTTADNLDPQYAVSRNAAGFVRSAGRDPDNRVSMWVTGRNNEPIGIARFQVGGLRNGLDELGC